MLVWVVAGKQYVPGGVVWWSLVFCGWLCVCVDVTLVIVDCCLCWWVLLLCCIWFGDLVWVCFSVDVVVGVSWFLGFVACTI